MPSPLPQSSRRFLNDRLDWNLLRTYLVIAQEGSMSRAAARLHITQSAVSQALKRLEEQLDCVLIVRSGRRFDLTETGEEVLRIAADVYGDISRLGPVIESPHDDVVGKVRILTISGIQSPHYDEFLADFHESHPNVELEVEVMGSSNIISALLQKTATVGIGLSRLPQPRLEQRVLFRERYGYFCGQRHRLFGQTNLRLEQLATEHFVSFTSDQLGGNLSPLTLFRDQQGFTGKIVASSTSFEEIHRLICAGFGIGCLPVHLVQRDVEQGLLWRLPPEEGVVDLDIRLLWNREQKMTQAETVFLESSQHLLNRHEQAL
ncbi:LysR family transcriptional regulator [Pseudomonas sp. FW306-02-F02-AA]|uniref:LysR family transcriptional regulator n=1 Tax=Pseudomonas fluorescens TaxID=294 RepID=A0A0N7H0H5_PSEFL|nr:MULTISPECIES: LysR family transcriptional regulator [Pseudomonas]ALI03156.1 LysR family transcriptional regulator [Pseudomonas fluorescens]PMZ00793.1 LysR family transcriptional regulator [Pseudomonas sp. FW306-02-F02-AB]PMZ06646.1 LysR family transcriptional regulator [Pseudomonas sp. FW306-02-H06C]PMZ12575.1 LysR family transcriptional regulator [Pseudomonas sp. FW306-02-F02-AA]PMZ18455.1 LysR family transcriptional regulator [Pseudomonas sp. FW306-02-F08-AA]